ncbi:hypothetical protein DFH09DRAFT_1167874 [Mycena vulgaris]|nr:hypothetical protein DFH09DRAFT_1175664 [Mycena vulgaris]KAJ6552121.1 hypothetical protein DFH09DRAFT_1167874 [Mycena vulgaris]
MVSTFEPMCSAVTYILNLTPACDALGLCCYSLCDYWCALASAFCVVLIPSVHVHTLHTPVHQAREVREEPCYLHGCLAWSFVYWKRSHRDHPRGGRHRFGRGPAGNPGGVRLSCARTDLVTMGLDGGLGGNLYSTFIMPVHAPPPRVVRPLCSATRPILHVPHKCALETVFEMTPERNRTSRWRR